jgi:glycine/D-amino acid oxidase-like deaminating enzyme
MRSDIAIIGNGILGLTLAHTLMSKNPNTNITIIGPQHRSGAATAAAGAMLNCFAEVTESTFSTKAGQIKFEMALRSLDMWPAWLEKINSALPQDEHVKINQGTYVVLNSKSGKLDTNNYYEIQKTLKRYNEPFSFVHPDEIPGMNPEDDSRPLSALYLPREGSIDSFSVIEALTKILMTSPNIKFIDETVNSIEHINSKVSSVNLSSGTSISTNKIVLANGAFSQELIDKIPEIRNKIPRVFSGTGYSLIFESTEAKIEHVIRTPNRAGACGLHALPRRNGGVYIGASNNVHFYPQTMPIAGIVSFVINCGIAQINKDLYGKRLLSSHVGNRPATLDTFPLIGETSVKGLYLLTGTYRDGFHQAPYLSEYMAEQILSDVSDENYLFKPERKLIEIFTREESIQEVKKHYLAGAYEHGIKLPKFVPEAALEAVGADIAQDVYSALNINSYGLTPDMILMFAFDPEAKQKMPFLREYLTNILP